MYRAAKLLLYLATTIHWIACMYYVLNEVKLFKLNYIHVCITKKKIRWLAFMLRPQCGKYHNSVHSVHLLYVFNEVKIPHSMFSMSLNVLIIYAKMQQFYLACYVLNEV